MVGRTPRCQEDRRPITRPGKKWAMAANADQIVIMEGAKKICVVGQDPSQGVLEQRPGRGRGSEGSSVHHPTRPTRTISPRPGAAGRMEVT